MLASVLQQSLNGIICVVMGSIVLAVVLFVVSDENKTPFV
jgi:hypothetical protein